MSVFLEEYTLLEELGQGGFATVYKVRHNKLGYVRAIRVMNALIAHGESDAAFQQFLAECRILLRLGNGNHPNIVHIYQPLLRAQRAIVEMDYVDGIDISKYIRSKSSFVEVDEVINLIKDIGGALAYCHEDIYKYCMDRDEDGLVTNPADGKNVLINEDIRQRLIAKYQVIHNDLHSSNIIRRDNGSYVLLDFGLAIEGNSVVRSSRRRDGAPEFKSPEKWDNISHLSTQSDIYSFGVVLYEMLVGRVPFELDKNNYNTTQAEYLLCEAHKNSPVPPIFELRKAAFEKTHPGQTYNKDYPEWLEEIIMKCLSKAVDDRYKNGKDLYEYFKIKHAEELKKRSLKEIQTVVSVLQSQLEEALIYKSNCESLLQEANTQKAALQKRLDETMLYLEMQTKEYKSMKARLQNMRQQLNGATLSASSATPASSVEMQSDSMLSPDSLLSENVALQQQLNELQKYSELQASELEKCKKQNEDLQKQLNTALLASSNNSETSGVVDVKETSSSQKHWKYFFFVTLLLLIISSSLLLFREEKVPSMAQDESYASDSLQKSLDSAIQEKDSLQLALNEAVKNSANLSSHFKSATKSVDENIVNKLKQELKALQAENANLKKKASGASYQSSSSADKATINSLKQQVTQWKGKAQNAERELNVIKKQLGI